tara:strand:- start:561 stop:836 length:276 start_codon:yes stop_codon:yes gene_type:complete
MNIFDISDIRKIIFSYIYPVKITKGMLINANLSSFNPLFLNHIGIIDDIKKINSNNFRITMINESTEDDLYWYKVHTYLYSDRDEFKVISY